MGKCAIANAECPRTSDPAARRFCPAWHAGGVTWENVQTGQTVTENCAFRQLVPTLIELIRASNRPAASIDKMTTEMAARLLDVAHSVHALPRRLGHEG